METTSSEHLQEESGSDPVSVSFCLAHEAGMQLEQRGYFPLAADVLACALVDEAQRINNSVLLSLALGIEHAADQMRQMHQAMLRQRDERRALRPPPPPPSEISELGFLRRLLLCVPERVAKRATLPMPFSTLEELASRWRLQLNSVLRLWEDFLQASGGTFAITLERARETLLRGSVREVQEATWALITLDSTESDSADASCSFEEYLVFRAFTTAASLEEQFRFLWAIYDRDRDGALSRADLHKGLQVQQVRLGWDDAYTRSWVEYVFTVVRTNHAGSSGGLIHPEDLRSSLAQWAELRTLLMARESRLSPLAPRNAGKIWSGLKSAASSMASDVRRQVNLFVR